MTKLDFQQRAQQLRQLGMSVREIEKELGVSRSSVSLWVRDIELTEVQKANLWTRQRFYDSKKLGATANAVRFREQRLQYQQVGRAKAREGNPLHHAGCMLYWAEGEKSKNTLNFVNSDANMMLLFIQFLREEMQVADDKISI